MFDNKTMRQPVKGKPHIAFIEGYWRVSPHHERLPFPNPWTFAHRFATKLNRDINYARIIKHEH